MEKKSEKRAWRVVRSIFGIIAILIGTFFIFYGVLCLYVDGVHFVIYTITPAITMPSYFLAWLLLRRRKPQPEERQDGQ